MDPSTTTPNEPRVVSLRKNLHGSRDDVDGKHSKKNNLGASKDIALDKKLNTIGGETLDGKQHHEELDKKVRFDDKIQQEIANDLPEVDKLMKTEEKKDAVYEVKPYFSHSILQATMFVYVVWTIIYLFYRGVWTLNNDSIASYVFSALFLFVEVLSFFTTTLHFNNFTNPQTNIMLQKLPEILARQKKDYPPVATFICCYKEPQHIVSRTIGYPPPTPLPLFLFFFLTPSSPPLFPSSLPLLSSPPLFPS
jgi:hypothetical protein